MFGFAPGLEDTHVHVDIMDGLMPLSSPKAADSFPLLLIHDINSHLNFWLANLSVNRQALEHIALKEMPRHSEIRNSGTQTQHPHDTSISKRFLSAQQPRHCTSTHTVEQAQETSSTYPIENISS